MAASGTARPPLMPKPATTFVLPQNRQATEPPERRGVPRDGVRLLVARSQGIEHHRFSDLPSLLEPGDLLVINTSATLPAALTARISGNAPTAVHVSTLLDDGDWVVEVRRQDNDGPDLTVSPRDTLQLPGGARLDLRAPYPDADAGSTRLWRASVTPALSLEIYLARYGRPIRYRYLAGAYPLSDHQNVYATEPGSAEMASAGRPFTAKLLVRLIAKGVLVAPLVLHAGVSSPELKEPPPPERFQVPEVTARLVNLTRDSNRRVVAVGTTVVRALETGAGDDGTVSPGQGWTDLVLSVDRPAKAVTALITGLHPPEASHLLLLEAVAGRDLVGAAYDSAVRGGYRWHEFGDSMFFERGHSART